MYNGIISALIDSNGKEMRNKQRMTEICKNFYTELFKTQTAIPPLSLTDSAELLPEILLSEVRHALSSMKNDKAPGNDGITSEMIRAGGPQLWKILAKKFSRYLQEQKIPSDWKQSRTILLHKKNDKRDLKNYRPICLLSQMYKLFTRIILNRISSTLEEQQPKEQAGFRKGYSTTDHLFVINQLLERCREYKIPICLAFIDYDGLDDKGDETYDRESNL